MDNWSRKNCPLLFLLFKCNGLEDDLLQTTDDDKDEREKGTTNDDRGRKRVFLTTNDGWIVVAVTLPFSSTLSSFFSSSFSPSCFFLFSQLLLSLSRRFDVSWTDEWLVLQTWWPMENENNASTVAGLKREKISKRERKRKVEKMGEKENRWRGEGIIWGKSTLGGREKRKKEGNDKERFPSIWTRDGTFSSFTNCSFWFFGFWILVSFGCGLAVLV